MPENEARGAARAVSAGVACIVKTMEMQKKMEQKYNQLIKWLKIASFLFAVLTITLISYMMIVVPYMGKEKTEEKEASVIMADNMTPIRYSIAKARKQIAYIEGYNQGSGIIVAEDNDTVYILTNQHVVPDGHEIQVKFYDMVLVPARIETSSIQKDLAIVTVRKRDLSAETKNNISAVTLGNSKNLSTGDPVFAIGNALGYGETVTQGIVSGFRVTDFGGINCSIIQTDAALNDGNSGGGLFDENGNLIGITTMRATRAGADGMGYAIAVNDIKDYIAENAR